MAKAASVYREAFWDGLRPDPAITVSAWADAHRRLRTKGSAEPGRWRTARTPYLREIMDAMSPSSPVEEIVLLKGSQLGGTEAILNVIGYVIDHAPGPILAVQPTLLLGRRFSRQRVDPLVSDTPRLAGKVSPVRSRDAGNTLLAKDFPGGVLVLTGANSAAGLKSMPARWLLLDEIDVYPRDVDDEGDPIDLAIVRQRNFPRRKRLLVSSPTVAGASRIEARYEASDQRRYYVPCPSCGAFQVLRFEQLKWEEGRPRSAWYVCEANGCVIQNHEKTGMLERGEWRAERPGADPSIRGYRISALYSPVGWLAWGDVVQQFLKAKDDPTKLRVFVNTVLAETWEEAGERVEPHVLLARRERYEAEVPAEACCLTMGVDTQDDRLELTVWGWGPGEESWLVDTQVLPGDPERPEPWQMLDEVLGTPYRHASGALLPILATCIDSAGHRTDYVYNYVRARQHQRVFATIGRDGDRPIVSAPLQKRTGRNPRPVPLYTIGVDMAKALLASRLRITGKGPGFVHLPLEHPGVDEEFVAQLTAEKLVRRHVRGVLVQRWVQTRPRNEKLDCTILALAAVKLLNPRLDQMARRLAEAAPPPPPPAEPAAPAAPAESLASGAPAQPPASTAPAPPPAPKPAGRRVWRSRYLLS